MGSCTGSGWRLGNKLSMIHGAKKTREARMGFQAFLADNVTRFIGHIVLYDDYAWNPMMRILLALALGTLTMTV
jgi:hypothetical protein